MSPALFILLKSDYKHPS